MTGESIHAVQMLECSDDAEVVLKAVAVLKSRPEHQNAEVWDGQRIVARIPRLHRP